MSDNDDNMLDEFDLSAWDAPPPAPGLADAVIDRMGGTDVGIAVPVEEHAPAVRRGWIIAGAAVAAILLGIGVWSLIRATHHAAPTSGGVVAEHARSLSLDTVHADLDTGADVRWKREGGVLHVEQRAGRVAWHVDDGEQLVISAGVDAGAALASVEATGANLRVEVQMNAMDARVIGASALTAAAVAMVTVVVYEGHVKVGRSGGQTVVVAPGTTYQVKAEDKHEAPTVGAGTVDTPGTGTIALLGLELDPAAAGVTDTEGPVVAQVLDATLREMAKTQGPYALAPGSGEKALTDEKILMDCESEAPACMAAIGKSLGGDHLLFGHMQPVRDGYQITLKLLDVAAQKVEKTATWMLPKAEAQAAGFSTWGAKIYLEITSRTASPCDAEALKDKGMANINLGQHAAALAQLEASLRCKQDPYVVQLAFMESCASSNSPKAKLYYKQMSPAEQKKLAPICISVKVAYQDDAADTRCDEVSCVLTDYEGACCDKYRKPSSTPEGLDRAAIQREMNRIKPDIYACGDKFPAGGKVKAKVSVGADGAVTSVAIAETPDPAMGACIAAVIQKATFPATKNGGGFTYPFIIPARTPAQPKSEPQPPAACDAAKLKEQGMENINMGQHAAALALFEKSIQCKRDPYVLVLAFMEACSSGNSPKAKQYYKQMTPAAQAKFSQICVRNKVDYE